MGMALVEHRSVCNRLPMATEQSIPEALAHQAEDLRADARAMLARRGDLEHQSERLQIGLRCPTESEARTLASALRAAFGEGGVSDVPDDARSAGLGFRVWTAAQVSSADSLDEVVRLLTLFAARHRGQIAGYGFRFRDAPGT